MVIKEHEDFAREIVALARKHGVVSLKTDFRISSFRRKDLPQEGYESITIDWHDGRHGAESQIRLSTVGAKTISETTHN